MKNDLSCAVVRDLLPSYVDGVTSTDTNAAVEKHLAGCTACAEAAHRMQAPETSILSKPAEVDYLKKIRRSGRLTAAFVGLGVLFAALCLGAYLVFGVGTRLSAGDVAASVRVEGNTVEISGQLLGSATSFSDSSFTESDGIVDISISVVPALFAQQDAFSCEYTAHAPVTQVRFDGLILWDSGTAISTRTAQLYAAKNPYVGDMPANSRIAAILGIGNAFGSFTNELQTKTEPYGWTLLLETPLTAETEAAACETMRADSCVLLATIENLGSVSWQYETADGTKTLTVTADDATAYAGKDIKQCGESAAALQALMQKLSLLRP